MTDHQPNVVSFPSATEREERSTGKAEQASSETARFVVRQAIDHLELFLGLDDVTIAANTDRMAELPLKAASLNVYMVQNLLGHKVGEE